MTQQPTSAPHADLAASSALFGANPAEHTTKPSKDPAKSSKRAQKPKSKPSEPQPSKAKASKSKSSKIADAESASSFSMLDLSDSRAVYIAIKATNQDKSLMYHLAKVVAERYSRRDLGDGSRTRGLLTADQVSQIISDTLRDGHSSGKLTGADVKSLTSTLKDMMPELFGASTAIAKPDPCAIMAYICSWSGSSGDQIIQDLGGREFVAAKLSDILKTTVSVGV